MFLLKKIISAFILPPGCFVALLIIGGIWMLLRRRKWEGLFVLGVGVALWFASMSLLSAVMIKGLERKLTIPRDLKGDVIVLLGGGVYDDVKDLTGRGTLSGDLAGRLITAVRAHRKTGLPILVSGGSIDGAVVAESWVIQRFLLDLGVPPGKIIVEYRSRDTEENAKYTEAICARSGFRNPLLVTSAYHMKRSVLSFQRYGLGVTPLPSDFRSPDGLRFHLLNFVPAADALETTMAAFHEYLGIIYYRMTLPEATGPGA